MNTRSIMAVVALLTPMVACAGGDLACYEDDVSNAVTCYSQKSLRVNGGLASALMFTGGPKNVRATGFTIVVQCASGITHLKDRDGVSFSSGRTTDTPTLSAIAGWMCETPALPSPRKKL